MAFKCLECNQWQGSKARYKGGSICKKCNELNKLEVKLKGIYDRVLETKGMMYD